MQKVIISFIGGRPLPNIQFILHHNFDYLYLISSADSAGPNGNKQKLLKALPASKRVTDTYDVPPYNIKATIEVCEKIIALNPNSSFIIQIASEPTTMSIAAYQFVEKQLQNKVAISLLYSSRDGVVNIFDEQAMLQKIKINLRNYFKVYGWDVTCKNEENAKHLQVAQLLVENIEVAHTMHTARQFRK